MVRINNRIRFKIDFEDTPIIDGDIRNEHEFEDTIKTIRRKLYGK